MEREDGTDHSGVLGSPAKLRGVVRQEMSVCLSIRKAREMHRLLLELTKGKLEASNRSSGDLKVCRYLREAGRAICAQKAS